MSDEEDPRSAPGRRAAAQPPRLTLGCDRVVPLGLRVDAKRERWPAVLFVGLFLRFFFAVVEDELHADEVADLGAGAVPDVGVAVAAQGGQVDGE